jgi:hypothetical protein
VGARVLVSETSVGSTAACYRAEEGVCNGSVESCVHGVHRCTLESIGGVAFALRCGVAVAVGEGGGRGGGGGGTNTGGSSLGRSTQTASICMLTRVCPCVHATWHRTSHATLLNQRFCPLSSVLISVEAASSVRAVEGSGYG